MVELIVVLCFCMYSVLVCVLSAFCCRLTNKHVHYLQAIEFADDQSRCIYNDAFELFKTCNRGRDEHVDFSVEYNLPSYIKELAVRDPNKQWMSSNYFTLATCLCLTWPFRWLLNSSKTEYQYSVVKKVTINPTQVLRETSTGHPAVIDVANKDGQLLVDVPTIQQPITPPPPYEA